MKKVSIKESDIKVGERLCKVIMFTCECKIINLTLQQIYIMTISLWRNCGYKTVMPNDKKNENRELKKTRNKKITEWQ